MNSFSNKDTEDFVNTLSSYAFQPHILQPTRITNHSATLIDHIFFNSCEHHTISGNVVYDLTDHLPNFLIINKLTDLPRGYKIFRRHFSRNDESAVLRDIQTIEWEECFHDCNDVNAYFDSFHNTVVKIVDKHVPLKKLSRKEIKFLSKPWITKAIKKSICIKNNLYKKYIRTRNNCVFEKFKTYRNKLKHLIFQSKKEYYKQYFNSNLNNMKAT